MRRTLNSFTTRSKELVTGLVVGSSQFSLLYFMTYDISKQARSNAILEYSKTILIFLVDFTNQQKTGCLCLYSIKNPAYPEYSVMTESPIICLDVYKEVPYLICVGQYLLLQF